MKPDDFKDIIEQLKERPDDKETWEALKDLEVPNKKDEIIAALKAFPELLRGFLRNAEGNPEFLIDLDFSLNDMDILEPYIIKLDDIEIERSSAKNDGSYAIENGDERGNSLGNREDGLVRSTDNDDDLSDLDDILKVRSVNEADYESESDEIAGNLELNEEHAIKSDLDKALEELNLDESTPDDKRREHELLIKEASTKSYSFNESDIDDAIELFRKAFSIMDGSALEWHNYGQACLKRAQKKAGVFTYSFKGNYKDISDFYEALRAEKKAVSLEPKDHVYWHNLGIIYEMMNKKPLALYCFIQALNLQKIKRDELKSSDLLSGMSLDNNSIEFFETKIKNMESEGITPIDPFDDENVEILESQLRKEKIQKNLPLNHVELFEEAREKYMAGEIDDARNYLTEAIKLKDDFFDAWYLLGKIAIERAMEIDDPELQNIEFTDANRCLERAIEINPNSIEPYKVLSAQYEFLGARDDYIRNLLKIIELAPDNWEYRKKLSDVYLEKGINFHIYNDTTAADLYLRKSIDMYPYNPDSWLWYGKNLLLKGENDEAKKAFFECLHLDENNLGAVEGLKTVYLRKASIFKKNGKLQEALENLRELFKLDARNIEGLYIQEEIIEDYCEMGFDSLESGDLNLARDYFDKALGIRENYSYAWLGLALFYYKTKQHEKAINASIRVMEEWRNNIVENADEFMVEGVLNILHEISILDVPAFPGIERLGELSRDLLEKFMELNILIQDERILLKPVYIKIFNSFISAAKNANKKKSENFSKILEYLGASSLLENVSRLESWNETCCSGDEQVDETRERILENMRFFFNLLFNQFAFKCNTQNINNIVLFLNFLIEDFAISIPEVYKILNIIDNGEFIVKIIDKLATMTHVEHVSLTSELISMTKTKK
ncbi:MAG: tetratricopeptide repeat protein, partial [Promethearchaeota archaeon]